MKQKICTILFALIASVGTMFAESGTCGKNLRWNLIDGFLTISGTGVMTDYTYSSTPWDLYSSSIKSVILNDGVTSIGGGAFAACTSLTSITIPNSVTSIGDYAFYGCSALTSVTIPNSVTSIGAGAFWGCTGLASIEIPNSITSIGETAFLDCIGLTSIKVADNNANYCDVDGILFSKDKTQIIQCPGGKQEECIIPNSVTSIGDYAFYGCSALTSVTIPNSVTSIGAGAFLGCTGLASIEIPNSITSIANRVFGYCSGFTSVTIPNSVTSIGESAFNGCTGLTSIEIPNSVTSIGWSAFSGCSGLTSVTIPNSVTSIGESAFNGCTGLTSIEIPNSVTNIGAKAFYGCTGLTSVTIPNSVTSFGKSAFEGCTGLTSVTILNSVIGESAFSGCTGLTSIESPNSITSIGDSTFYGCSGLTSVTIPNSVTSFGKSAFEGCTGLTSVNLSDLAAWCKIAFGNTYSNPLLYAHNLYLNGELVTDLVIPNNVTKIKAYAFYGCSGLISATIPNSVTSIEWSAFYGCCGTVTINSNMIVSAQYSADYNMKNIFGNQVKSYIIGNEVTSIGDYAFYGCTGLTSVTIPNSVTSIGDNPFGGCSGLTVTINSNMIMNAQYSSLYSMKNIFGNQVKSYIIGNEVTSIGNYAFYGCSGLTSVTIPNSVTSIEKFAFGYCSSLTSVTIPNSVTNIGAKAFYGCTGLTSVTINSHVIMNKVHMKDIFGNQVTTYIIGDEVTSIGDSTYIDCSGMPSITIPNSVTSIGNYAFFGCSVLASIEIPNSVSNIGNCAFCKCSNLTSIEIPNSVTSIGWSAFSGCSGLTSVTIPNSVTSIREGSFWNCSSLTSIEIPNSVTNIGDKAFSGCSGLTSVTIPNSVTNIGSQAFYGCTGLTSVTCYATTPPSLGGRVFDDINDIQSIPLYVFKACASQYKNAYQWREFKVKLLDPDIFTITASAQNGIVEGAGTFWEDTTIQLFAIPKEGYVFQKWSDGFTINPRPIIVSENAVYEAEFVEKEAIPTGDVNLPYNEPFSSDMGKFSIKDVNLGGINYVWALTSNYGMKASAYVNKSYATESWLVSPLISLYNTKDIVLSFDHAVNKGTTTNLRVKISTDLGESWSDLTVPKWPAGTNWDFVSTSLSLDAYTNNVIQIAFVYKSTTSNCPTWEIKNFSIQGTINPEKSLPIDVEPEETSVDVTWLTISNANTYELIIRDKNGNVVCLIIFDAEGHALSVTHYAPSRDNAPLQEQANDFAYTVSGLTGETDYNFILIGKNNEDKVITSYSGSFRTKGSSQSIEDTPLDSDNLVKIFRDGQIYILHGAHIFDAQGKRVR